MRPLVLPADRAPSEAPAGISRRGHGPALAVGAAVALVVVCLVPLLVSGFDGLGRTWHPAGDWSVLELRARDVGSAHTPLIGPYSRYGWNHPGPLLFWVLAVPYRLLGQSSSSILLTAALVNAASIVGFCVFAWRRGRLALVAASTVGLALVCTHLGPSFLRDPWNPSITVLPFALFVLLAWSAWEGDRLALPVLAFTGSLLAQSHIGFALLVVVLGVLAVVGFGRRVTDWRTSAWWAGALLAVCWLPVLIDQLFGSGNLGDLLGYFGGGSTESPAGWGTALGVIARELGGVAPWLGGVERGSSFDGGLVTESAAALVVPALAFAGALVVARGRGARQAVRFQVVVATATLAGFVSVARVTGPVYAYLVRWLWVLAFLWWLSVFWSLWSAVFAPDPMREQHAAGEGDRRAWWGVRRWAPLALAVLALVVVGRVSARTADGVDRIGTPDGEWYVTLDEIVDDVVAGAPREGPVLVRATGSNNGSIADALRLQLDRAGVPVAVDEDQTHKYGEGRVSGSSEPVAVMTVVTGSWTAVAGADYYGDVVASWDPLTVDERRFASLLEDRLADQLSLVGRNDLVTAMRSGGSLDGARRLDGVEQDLLDAVEQYRRQGDPVTVYVDTDVPSTG